MRRATPGSGTTAGCQFVVIVVENLARDRAPKKLFQVRTRQRPAPLRSSQANQAVSSSPHSSPATPSWASTSTAWRAPHARQVRERFRQMVQSRPLHAQPANRTHRHGGGAQGRAGAQAEVDHQPGATRVPARMGVGEVRRKSPTKSGALFMAEHSPTLPASSPRACTPRRCLVADFVTPTTHKTLRGSAVRDDHACKGGLWPQKIDSAVFPGLQGGPLMHIIAAKAVAFGEALKPEFKTYPCGADHQERQNAGRRVSSRRGLPARHRRAPTTTSCSSTSPCGKDANLATGRRRRTLWLQTGVASS